LETELNLDLNWNSELITEPNPKLQLISDPAGSGSTTLEGRIEGRKEKGIEGMI
jgi:hypothetical protein